MSAWQGVLFDLDGTLIDSAPDLAAAVNRMRARRGMSKLPLEDYRAWAGAGARGMLNVGFDLTPDDADFLTLRDEFFNEYASALADLTQIFAGVPAMLNRLSMAGVSWGIVTNKMERFTLPLLELMPEFKHAACVVGGDTTPHAKPHPLPLFEACRRAGLEPGRSVYVGDDLRDIQAGRAAGMTTVAVTYGYLGFGQDVNGWGADVVVDSPEELLKWLDVA